MPGAAQEVRRSLRRLRQAREAARRQPAVGDHGTGLVLGCGAVLVSIGWPLLAAPPGVPDIVMAAVLGALFVLALRVEFVMPGGSLVPTQPVLTGMVLLLPPPLVPVTVLLAVLLADLRDLVRRSPDASAVIRGALVGSTTVWCAAAASAVIAVAAPRSGQDLEPVALALVYALSFAAQVAADTTVLLVRGLALDDDLRAVLHTARWAAGVDSALAAPAFCVAVVARENPWAVAALAAPVLLIRTLGVDRTRQFETALTLTTALDSFEEEARVDPLTGLANRRAWDEALETWPGTGSGPIGVLMADVDGLKYVNDVQGHDAGDRLIRVVADLLAGAAPPGALAARLGGDEFGVLVRQLTDADPDGTALRARITAAASAHEGIDGVPVSASLGFAREDETEDLAAAVRLADARAGEDKQRRKVARGEVPRRRSDDTVVPPTSPG